MDQVIDFELHQTTPPVGPTNTVAQVFFAANDTRLITTVKGDPSAGKAGFVSVLPFKDSCSSVFESHDIRSSPPSTAVLFGGVEIPGTSDLFITDASFGATVLSLDDVTDEVSSTRSPSKARKPRVGLPTILEVRNDGSKILTILDLRNGDPGLTDVRAIGHYVYALSPGNGTTVAAITVVDSFEGRQIQHFELDKLGAGQRSQGLAIFEK
ncbi:hypothetical protein CBS147332_4379 [Penicillium roqueforti]|nr:hypothetical protein CBS147332_4379 [Penicillium roqueforti]KAI3118153.1 hypothetical protein CBS147331_3092 [Penicillium roqueforti]